MFYTVLPLPARWGSDVTRVARWAPLVGLGLGAIAAGSYLGLAALGCPPLTRSVLIVALSWRLTGGLHLDGAIDTADGLAVGDPARRLAVMQDSRTGAFGVMAALAIALLKVAALRELAPRVVLWVLPAAAAWGRWGQVVAIARYPYLKPTGKGAWHQRSFRQPQDLLLSTVTVLGFAALHLALAPDPGPVLGLHSSGSLLALGLGFSLHRRLGGHTGDTYGAIVEWSEALLLAVGATLWPG